MDEHLGTIISTFNAIVLKSLGRSGAVLKVKSVKNNVTYESRYFSFGQAFYVARTGGTLSTRIDNSKDGLTSHTICCWNPGRLVKVSIQDDQ